MSPSLCMQQIGVGVTRCPHAMYAIVESRQPRTRQEFAAIARARHAAHLRAQGMSLAAIGREFGVTRERARQIVNRAVAS
jgi:Sigma-70, region 4